MADTDTTFCANCGTRISARARFCPSCGSDQGEFKVGEPEPAEAPAPPEPTPAPPEPEPAQGEPDPPLAEPEPSPEPAPPPAPAPPKPAEPAPATEAGDAEPAESVRPTTTQRIGRVDPQAAELSELLVARLAVPGLIGAALAALIAAAGVLAVGLVVALITPDASNLGRLGVDGNVVTEGFRQAVGTLLAPTVATMRFTPMLLVAVPIAAVALAVRTQLGRTAQAKPLVRVGWAVAVAPLFALLMLAFAVLGDVEVGGAFGLGLLWGVVGGLLAVAGELPPSETSNPLVTRALAASGAALRPLAAVGLLLAALGLAGWLAQVGSDADDVRFGRSAAVAVIEETAYAGEHAVGLATLGAGARVRADAEGALGLPFPVDDPAAVPGPDGALRIFSYSGPLPAYLLLPAIIVLMGALALSALYAGFAAARAAGAAELIPAAGWGALTGPLWAVAMAVATALAGGAFHGDADSGSVVTLYLFAGAALGAAGGALSAQRAPA